MLDSNLTTNEASALPTLHILLCDDEERFLTHMKTTLLSLATSCGRNIMIRCIQDPNKLRNVDFRSFDIAFLDIDMGELNGIELARYIRQEHSDLILIFVTNYVEYSLDGYEVQAFRYLLKSELDEKLPDYFHQAIKACGKARNVVHFSYQRNNVDILPSHILYIETCQRHLLLHLIHEPNKTLPINGSISNLADQLHTLGFLQVHQSYLVNMCYIQKMMSTGIWIKNGEQLPISARNYQDLKQKYLTWKGMQRWNL